MASVETQAHKAVKALSKFSKKNELLDTNEDLFLIVALQQMPKKLQVKPLRLSIPHPFLQESHICVFVKDNYGQEKGQPTDEDGDYEGVEPNNATIMTVKKLHKNYKSFEQKRALRDQYDLFVADQAVLPVLPRLLGKAFFTKKKQPVAINTRDVDAELEKVRSSTFVYLNLGTCLSIKVGNMDMQPEQLVANTMAVYNQLLEVKPTKDNIQSVNLKLATSTALPIFQQLPDFESNNDE
jgi:ribosome biogenesis protein UTP30